MDQYAFYIWSAYAVAAFVLIVLALASVLGARVADRTVAALRAATGRGARRGRDGIAEGKEAGHGG